MRVTIPVELDTLERLPDSSGYSPWSPASPPPSLQFDTPTSLLPDGEPAHAPGVSAAIILSKARSSARLGDCLRPPPRRPHRLPATAPRRAAQAAKATAPAQPGSTDSKLLELGTCRSLTTPESRLSGSKVIPLGAEVGGLASWSEADLGKAGGPWDESPLLTDVMLRVAERASNPAPSASHPSPDPSPTPQSSSSAARSGDCKAAGAFVSGAASRPHAHKTANQNQNHNVRHHHPAGALPREDQCYRPGNVEGAHPCRRPLLPELQHARNEMCASFPVASRGHHAQVQGTGSPAQLGETAGARVSHDPFLGVAAPCPSLPDVFRAHTHPRAQTFYKQMRLLQRRRSSDSASGKARAEWACATAGMCARGQSPSPAEGVVHEVAPAQGGLDRGVGAFRRGASESPEPTSRAGGAPVAPLSPARSRGGAGCVSNPLAHPSEARDHLLLKHSTLRRSYLLGETSPLPFSILGSPDRRPIGGGGGATRTRAFLGMAMSNSLGGILSTTDYKFACPESWSGLTRPEHFNQELKQERSAQLTGFDDSVTLSGNAYIGFVFGAGAGPKRIVQGSIKQGQSSAMEFIGQAGVRSPHGYQSARISDAIDDMLLRQQERVDDSDHMWREQRRQVLSARNTSATQDAVVRNRHRQL